MKTPGKVLAQQIREIQQSQAFAVRSDELPTWCPGCGYFGITMGLNNAITRLGLPRHKVMIVSGIGCAGRYPFFMGTYGFHTVHGRALPVATGIKLANPELTVFVVGGDGDGLAIGGGHLPHVARRNVNINYLLFDNSIYALTKGQPSPSTPLGIKTKNSPQGNPDQPLNATLLALAYRVSFLARLYAGNHRQITAVVSEAVQHPGFSLCHIYTPCVTFDKQFKTWNNLKARLHPLPDDHDPTDLQQAMAQVLQDDYSLGILFKEERACRP